MEVGYNARLTVSALIAQHGLATTVCAGAVLDSETVLLRAGDGARRGVPQPAVGVEPDVRLRAEISRRGQGDMIAAA